MSDEATQRDWRLNPNLIECFNNCVAMLRDAALHQPRPISLREQREKEIRERRLALGLTQRELGERCGGSKTLVSNFENAIQGGDRTYERLAAALALVEEKRR